MHRTRFFGSIVFLLGLFLLSAALGVSAARAFCGFYVAQGDAKLYNQSSKVVIARDGDRTVLTMSSDYQGDPKEFAVVIPVPVVLKKEQVHVADKGIVERLSDYSVPRLVEYWDPNPCPPRTLAVDIKGDVKVSIRKKDSSTKQIVMSENLVTVMAQYQVDEYDILILSAEQGHALTGWLVAHGYRMPAGASRVLQSYIKQGMFFFVAKVNLAEQARLGFTNLRPIQVAYESPKFMLPIRLGMVNAQGAQEMFVFTLTRTGRVEVTNYRTVRMPTDLDLPEFVKPDFPGFYRQLFTRRHEREGGDAVFLEYCWNIVPNQPSCDPCTAPYLRPEELRTLGAFWIAADAPDPGSAMLTRLHLRYDAEHFPEDLAFQTTADRQNWQTRYVIHHAYAGTDECPQLAEYHRTLWDRRRHEAENYCDLTGINLDQVRQHMGVKGDWSKTSESATWWERIWNSDK